MNRTEISKAIDNILIPYANYFSWSELGAAVRRVKPNEFDISAKEEYANTLAAVQLEMEKLSSRHIVLAKKVAELLEIRCVTYPWLRDTVSFIFSGTRYEMLQTLVKRFETARCGMQAKGLSERI